MIPDAVAGSKFIFSWITIVQYSNLVIVINEMESLGETNRNGQLDRDRLTPRVERLASSRVKGWQPPECQLPNANCVSSSDNLFWPGIERH